MKPGYRKRTKKIKIKDAKGFPNYGQTATLIRDIIGSTEFYEIESAEVLKVNIDFDDPDFPTANGGPDFSMIGSIWARLLISQKGAGKRLDVPIRPISPHIVQLPLVGERVNIAEYDGQLFYFNPLNSKGRISSNSDIENDGKVYYPNIKYNRRIVPKHGDTIFQGRFGQAIHFGSDANNVQPNIKISVGQKGTNEELNNFKRTNIHFPHFTNINNDEASIHITTNEHNPLKTGAKSDAKGPDTMFNESLHSNIILNADSLIFNAKKKKINMFAAEHIVTSAKLITLESGQGKIELGEVGANNPVVGATELKTVLTEFTEGLHTMLNEIMASINKMNEIVSWPETEQEEIEKYMNAKKKKVKEMISDLEYVIDDELDKNDNVFIGTKSKLKSDVKWEEA